MINPYLHVYQELGCNNKLIRENHNQSFLISNAYLDDKDSIDTYSYSNWA